MENELNENKEQNETSARGGKFWVKVGLNVLAMMAVGAFLVWLSSLWLDSWTSHGEFAVVPEVKSMAYDEAENTLLSQGFEVVLSDSIYDTNTKPGTVLSQNPKCGAKVKNGRTVYLTVNAFSPRLVTIPNLMDVSVRQARSTLEGLGLKDIEIKLVPSDYKDLVMSVKRDGKLLLAGSRIPMSSKVVLEVGMGPEEALDDEGDSTVVMETLDLL